MNMSLNSHFRVDGLTALLFYPMAMQTILNFKVKYYLADDTFKVHIVPAIVR